MADRIEIEQIAYTCDSGTPPIANPLLPSTPTPG